MNRLSRQKQADVVRFYAEGLGIRAISRQTHVSINGVTTTLKRVARALRFYNDHFVRSLVCNDLELDEQWGFVYAKPKTVPMVKSRRPVMGEVWTWIAQCRRSRFVVSYLLINSRGAEAAEPFLLDVAARIENTQPMRVTTDLHPPYLAAIERAFPEGVQHVRTGAPLHRDAPPSALIRVMAGEEVERGGTNHVERLNGTIRHFAATKKRKGLTFAKSFANMDDFMQITIAHYNYCWVPETLRVTPAIEIGLTERIWEISDLIDISEEFDRLWREHKTDKSAD